MSSEINGDDNFTTKRFETAELAIVAAGDAGGPIAHGLPVKPFIIQAVLICKTAEHNYSIGDELMIAVGLNSTSAVNDLGISIVPDATDLNIRYGSNANVFVINDKNTGASVFITIANWKLILRAIP